jgi:rubredoxin
MIRYKCSVCGRVIAGAGGSKVHGMTAHEESTSMDETMERVKK